MFNPRKVNIVDYAFGLAFLCITVVLLGYKLNFPALFTGTASVVCLGNVLRSLL